MQGNLDKGIESRIIQIDLSAALDIANHNALLFQLQNLGTG